MWIRMMWYDERPATDLTISGTTIARLAFLESDP